MRRLAIVFVACLFALAYFVRVASNPNENSRMAPVLAAFWQGTLSIDAYASDGPTSTTDRSVRGGRAYSDKAPGTSMLAALGYAPLYLVERLTHREAPYGVRKWCMTVAAVAIPLAAALCALFSLVSTSAGLRAAAAITALALFATPLLPFGSALVGHALAGALLFLAFAVIRRAAERPAPTRWRDLAAAGALLGLVAATEFPAVPAALLVIAYGLVRLGRRGELGRARTWVAPVLGAAPFAVGLALWNLACFGSPFSLGYQHLAVPVYRSIHSHGLVGVNLPRLDVLYYLTVHPARGLFAGAPVLLLALPGLWAMARREGWRLEALLCLAVSCSFLAINAGFPEWWGGYSYTARHLVPAVPFLVLPIAFLSRRWLWVGIPLTMASVVQPLAAAFTGPFTADGPLVRLLARADSGHQLLPWGAWPLADQLWSELSTRAGEVDWPAYAPNGGRVLGLRGPASALPLLVGSWTLLWMAARTIRQRKPGGAGEVAPTAMGS